MSAKTVSRTFRNLFGDTNRCYKDPITVRKSGYSFKPKTQIENQLRKNFQNGTHTTTNNFQTYLVVKDIKPQSLADIVQRGPAIPRFQLDSINNHQDFVFPFKPINLPDNFDDAYYGFKTYVDSLEKLKEIYLHAKFMNGLRLYRETQAIKQEIKEQEQNKSN